MNVDIKKIYDLAKKYDNQKWAMMVHGTKNKIQCSINLIDLSNNAFMIRISCSSANENYVPEEQIKSYYCSTEIKVNQDNQINFWYYRSSHIKNINGIDSASLPQQIKLDNLSISQLKSTLEDLKNGNLNEEYFEYNPEYYNLQMYELAIEFIDELNSIKFESAI